MSLPAEVTRRVGTRAVRRVVYDAATIHQRVREIGRKVTEAYPDGDLLVVGLLKGSFMFLADLVREIERPVQVDFLRVSSYGVGRASSGEVTLLYDPETSLRDKHVLVVEDIIDSGRTLTRLLELLRTRGPASLGVCALLDKQLAEPLPELRFVGFAAPPVFLVGYGLDHAEDFRHLPFIAELD
jgi:hypoxanthine phosphoribosyltransferase